MSAFTCQKWAWQLKHFRTRFALNPGLLSKYLNPPLKCLYPSFPLSYPFLPPSRPSSLIPSLPPSRSSSLIPSLPLSPSSLIPSLPPVREALRRAYNVLADPDDGIKFHDFLLFMQQYKPRIREHKTRDM